MKNSIDYQKYAREYLQLNSTCGIDQDAINLLKESPHFNLWVTNRLIFEAWEPLIIWLLKKINNFFKPKV